ncbi:MAG: hypothetical protein ABIE68_02105 [bacterium]
MFRVEVSNPIQDAMIIITETIGETRLKNAIRLKKVDGSLLALYVKLSIEEAEHWQRNRLKVEKVESGSCRSVHIYPGKKMVNENTFLQELFAVCPSIMGRIKTSTIDSHSRRRKTPLMCMVSINNIEANALQKAGFEVNQN